MVDARGTLLFKETGYKAEVKCITEMQYYVHAKWDWPAEEEPTFFSDVCELGAFNFQLLLRDKDSEMLLPEGMFRSINFIKMLDSQFIKTLFKKHGFWQDLDSKEDHTPKYTSLFKDIVKAFKKA